MLWLCAAQVNRDHADDKAIAAYRGDDECDILRTRSGLSLP